MPASAKNLSVPRIRYIFQKNQVTVIDLLLCMMLHYYEMQEENKSIDSTIKLLASWTTS